MAGGLDINSTKKPLENEVISVSKNSELILNKLKSDLENSKKKLGDGEKYKGLNNYEEIFEKMIKVIFPPYHSLRGTHKHLHIRSIQQIQINHA